MVLTDVNVWYVAYKNRWEIFSSNRFILPGVVEHDVAAVEFDIVAFAPKTDEYLYEIESVLFE